MSLSNLDLSMSLYVKDSSIELIGFFELMCLVLKQ